MSEQRRVHARQFYCAQLQLSFFKVRADSRVCSEALSDIKFRYIRKLSVSYSSLCRVLDTVWNFWIHLNSASALHVLE